MRVRPRSLTLGQAWPIALLACLGYLVLVPLFRLQARAFEDGGTSYRALVNLRGLGSVLWTTLALAAGSLAIAMILGTGLAWASTRLSRRLSWVSMLPVMPIVLPPVATVIGWAFLLSPRAGYINAWLRELGLGTKSGIPTGPINVYSTPWIIAITGFSLTSFVYVFIRSGLSQLNYELISAARVSGSPPWRTFFTVVLPVLRPSLVYGGTVAFLLGLGQFTAPLFLGQNEGVRVITTEVYRHAGNTPVDYGLAAALASPLLLAGLVIVIAQRALLSKEERFVSDVGKGGRQAHGTTSRLAAVAIGAYSIVAVVLPLLALVVVSLSPFWSGTIDTSMFSLDNFRELFDTPIAAQAIRTSILVSITGVLISLPVGYLITEVLVRRTAHSAVRWLMDVIVGLPLGIPAVVFGAGFLYTYTRPPFVLYGTNWAIILVYVAIMLPFTTRLQLAARISMGPSYEAAARVCGSTPLWTHLKIVVPMIRSALAGAAALIFVLLSHEFSASLLVRSTQTQVMGTALYDLWMSSSYPMVAAMALAMVFVTGVGLAIAVWAGGASSALGGGEGKHA